MEELLTDHFYSKNGVCLLKPGTPTNKTEDLPAGYSWIDDADKSYARIFKHSEEFTPADDPGKKTDGEKLADSLVIDDTLLKMVSNGNGRDQLEVNAMNTALFPSTLGYFMEEMMHPVFSDRDINATKMFFSSFISGRGPVPSIRIGKQPYGILPVSAYSRLKFFEQSSVEFPATINNAQTPYHSRLHSLLMKMDTTWDSLLPGAAFIDKEGDPHQVLSDVIGLNSNSVEFHQRYSQTQQQLYNPLNLQWGPLFASPIAVSITQRGKQILVDPGIENKDFTAPILEKYFLSNPNVLNGPQADDVPESETKPIRVYYVKDDAQLNYIEWLRSISAENIGTENFESALTPTALLYLLLRHALLLSQADAATKLLVSNKIFGNKKVFLTLSISFNLSLTNCS